MSLKGILMDKFLEKFRDFVHIDQNGFYEIKRLKFVDTLRYLINHLNFNMLLDITAIDYLEFKEKKSSRFALIYLLRSEDFKSQITLKVYISNDMQMPSISRFYKSANWAEREVWDQYGITFTNHPNLKRILNHQGFIGHPLRKDYPITQGQWCEKSDDLMDEMRKNLNAKESFEEDDLMYLNLGPAHPASHGTIRTFVALEGESIVSAVTEIGYLHRGFEKSCENHTYNQIIPYTDRLNYCSAILNNIGFAHAVEEMLDISLPLRGQYIRVIVGELSRIIDHLVCLGAILVDMGALTNYWYLFNPRDKVYNLLSKLTGARLTNSYMRIGGVAHDLYNGFEKDLNQCIKDIKIGVNDTLKLILHNRIFHDRTQNIGVINKQEAISYGLTGPNLRASGIAYDIRKVKPYYVYESFDFEVPIGSVGDVYDRIMVRFEEINQSILIINQAIKSLPKGDISIKDAKITLPKKSDVYTNIEGLMNQFKLVYEGVKVPKMEHYSSTEAGNGELGFFIVSDGSGTPYKVKVRPPCFYALSCYPKIVENSMIADAILTLGSLNIIAGELDR